MRLEAYDPTRSPLTQFYKELGLLVSVAATGSPTEIYQNTISALEAFRAQEIRVH